MKLIIAGSRSIEDSKFVHSVLDGIVMDYFPNVTEIVSGGARGVDTIAKTWAAQLGLRMTVFLADWNEYGKAAGVIRNKQMADYVKPDGGLIAIWDGKSRGTTRMIEYAMGCGLDVVIVRVERTEGFWTVLHVDTSIRSRTSGDDSWRLSTENKR